MRIWQFRGQNGHDALPPGKIVTKFHQFFCAMRREFETNLLSLSGFHAPYEARADIGAVKEGHRRRSQ
jgi:hypothetical protein